MKIVILERKSFGMDVDMSCFEEFGEFTIYNETPQELVTERIREADIVLCNKVKMSPEVLSQAVNLKMIGEMATGFDNIDIDYCREHGIAVYNAGHYSTDSVAQHTFALALYLLNQMPYYDRVVKDGTYTRSGQFSIFDATVTELAGKTWGIVGLGMIGQKVAKIATAFGCHVVFFSASGRSTCTEYPRLEWEEFLSSCDVISLHCPLSDRTHHLMDADAFAGMKSSAILINVARGPVVDQDALYQALMNEQIAGAGLDVLEAEPMVESNPLNRITDSGKLVITPHMGWASYQARSADVAITYNNVKYFLSGGTENRIV